MRERKEDIPLLVNHYLQEFSKRYNKILDVDDILFSHLTKYHWPGNIRELQHAVERAVILSRQPLLTSNDFQLSSTSPTVEAEKVLNLMTVEKEVIRQAVMKSNGNLTLAAEELGIGRTTLYRKMDEYGLSK